MATKPMTVSLSGNFDKGYVTLNDQQLLKGAGEAPIPALSPEAYHSLSWYVEGQQGSSYTIRITNPLELDHTAKIGSNNKSAGQHWFWVN